MIRLGPVEVVALHHVHAHLAQHQQGAAVLHEFGHGLLAHAARHFDDRADEDLVVAFQRQVADEHAVDLEDVGLQVLEVGERREAGAEYVFVLNVVEGTRGFPSQIQDDPALQLAMPAPDPFPFAEERRLFYVAMTRARKQVRLYTTLGQPSRFLVELAKKGLIKIEPIDGELLEPCPECGRGVLQLRSGPYSEFHGCSRFPACSFTRKVDQSTATPAQPRTRAQRLPTSAKAGDQCPACKQGVIQARNGRHGPFLGCSRFQEGCKATRNLSS